jgi:hypothetical protein
VTVADRQIEPLKRIASRTAAAIERHDNVNAGVEGTMRHWRWRAISCPPALARWCPVSVHSARGFFSAAPRWRSERSPLSQSAPKMAACKARLVNFGEWRRRTSRDTGFPGEMEEGL